MLRQSTSMLCAGVSRSLSSLRSLHREFLDLVKDNGDEDGAITARHINDRVREIKISNTRTKNSITGKMMNELADIVDNLELPSDPLDQTVAILLRGEGDTFCSGADLSLVRNTVNTPGRGEMMSLFMTDCLNRFLSSKYISCCVINGPAIGGGAEITTSCDFRVMVESERSYVQFIHCTLGASTGFGGSSRLSSVVSRQSALLFLSSSSRISVQTGLQTGYINEKIECSTDMQMIDASLKFISPFTNQKFYNAVRSFKSIVSQNFSKKKDDFDFETAVFKGRWMSGDNKSALHRKDISS